MNRLVKPQEYDSYEIEEPSDEERAESRWEPFGAISLAWRCGANQRLATSMLICKHRETDWKEVITFDIKNKFIVQQIAHMFAVCHANILTFGLIKTSLKCSV